MSRGKAFTCPDCPDRVNGPERCPACIEKFRASNMELAKPAPVLRIAKPTETHAPSGLRIKSLGDFKLDRVEWIDKPFLQRAAFHLLAGRKGVCKGTYLAGLCARMSTGRLGETRRVLVITSEDSIRLDFGPRVTLAGGDPGLIDIVQGDFMLPRDIGWIKGTAQAIGNVGMIVIDPIGNHIGGIDSNGEHAVRPAIGPLCDLADDLDCMVIGVRHLTKSAANGALASVLGSTAWVDVPRAVILMAADDDDPEWTFHMQVVAGNRGPKGGGRRLKLHLRDLTVPGDPEPIPDITFVADDGASDKDVEDLLTHGGTKDSKSKSEQAGARILSILEDEGEQESDTLDARIAAEFGLAAQTIKNIRAKLSKAGLIRAVPPRDERGEIAEGGKWHVKRTHAPNSAVPTLARRGVGTE